MKKKPQEESAEIVVFYIEHGKDYGLTKDNYKAKPYEVGGANFIRLYFVSSL